MTNTQLEGTLPAVKAAIASITPKTSDDATLLNVAQNALSARIDAQAATPGAANGCRVSLAVDGKTFRCAFSVSPVAILV